MRVLLDECVPRRLAQAFGPDHSIATVTGLGWAGTKNGELVRMAADNGFEALVTVDVGLPVAADVPLSVLVLRAGSKPARSAPAAHAQADPVARVVCHADPFWRLA